MKINLNYYKEFYQHAGYNIDIYNKFITDCKKSKSDLTFFSFNNCLVKYVNKELDNLNIQLLKHNYKIIYIYGIINIIDIEKNINIKWKWTNIKKYFKNNVTVMTIFFNFRKELVDNILNIIFNYNNKCNNSCKFISSGSIGPHANLESDYDLTVTGHFNMSTIIKIFNDTIYYVFKTSSGEAFDTNIYGYSFLINNDENIKLDDNKYWKLDTIKSKYYEIRTDQIYSLNQDIWAYLRLYSLIYPLNLNMIMFLFNINDHYKLIKNTIMQIDNYPKIKYASYIKYMNIFEKNIQSSNSKITKESLIDNLSFMNAFGEETYFTQGAFMHVLGTMFYYKDIKDDEKKRFLKEYYIIHSLVENAAYFIKTMVKNNFDIIYSSKYLERFMNAYYLLSNNKDVLIILNKLNFFKSKLRNKTDTEIYTDKSIMGELINYSDINIYKSTKINEVNKIISDLIFKSCSIILDNNKYFYIYSVLFLLKNILDNYKKYTYLSITYELHKDNYLFRIKKNEDLKT